MMARQRRMGMNARILVFWLCMWTWAAASELSAVTGVPVATVNRNLDRFYERGWAVSRVVGRGTTAMRRWRLTSEFLEEEFAVDHRHRGTDGPEDHCHNSLDFYITDHRHLPWPLGQAGVGAMYDRLPSLISFIDIALRLFDDAGLELRYWIGDDKPVLIEWRFLRRGQLLEAVAVYENSKHSFEVGFYWFGRQLKPVRMMEKWVGQVDNLAYTSEAMELELRTNPYLLNQTDPDFDPSPQLSLHVMVCVDEYAARQAMELIPKSGYHHEKAFSWWVAGDPCRKIGESGRAWPGGDMIVDRFEDARIGEPERVAPPTGGGHRDEPPFPQSMSFVLPYRIFSLAEEHAAIRQEDAADIFSGESEDVPAAFAALERDKLLLKLEDEYYLTDSAMIYAADRDRVAVTIIRDRLLTLLHKNGQRRLHDLGHNRGMWRIVKILNRHGIKVYGGWRGVRHFQGLTQIQPDGLLYADGPWGKTLYFLEYERSATTPEEIATKLRTYRKALRLGIRFRVIWITDTRQAATRFLERAWNLDVMVATLDELDAGPIAGPATIWRSTADGNVELRPYETQQGHPGIAAHFLRETQGVKVWQIHL